MLCQIETLSPVKRRVDMQFSAAEVDAALDGFIKTLPSEAAGKLYDDEIREQTTDNLISAALFSLLEREKIYPLGRLGFSGEAARRGEVFKAAVSFEVLPEIALPEKLEAIEVKVAEPLVTAEMLSAFMQRLRRSKGELREIAEKRPAQPGDVLRVDVAASCGGEDLPGLSAVNHTFKYGGEKGALQLSGLAAGLLADQESEAELPCPEDYPDERLRDRPVRLKIRLRAIFREVLPPVDEDFAVLLGFDNLKKLHEFVYNEVHVQKMLQAKREAQRNLLANLVDGLDFPLPDCLVNAQLKAYLHKTHDFLRRKSLDDEELARRMETARHDGLEPSRTAAKAQAFLMALGLRHNVPVTDEEIDEKIAEIAKLTKQDFLQLQGEFAASGAVYELWGRILAEKALELLYHSARKVVVDANGASVSAAGAQD